MLINKLFTWPIKLYQWTLSPILGANCRFVPSCSQYMIDAIEEWGLFKGLWLGIKRITRCNPWGGHGHDPVPRRQGFK
ncbi:MAG: membrane protein insertion efficiency factor YidD [Saprospiraceae bacterium]